MLFDDMEQDDELFDEFESGLVDDDLLSSPETEVSAARATSNLLGHEGIEQNILQMLETGRFPHGLIFSGPSGIGKSVMAYRLARFLFSEKDREPDMFGTPEVATSLFVAEDNPVFGKVLSGAHPDLLTIGRLVDDATGRTKASVQVEEIRKIAPFMRRTASVENGWRIVIVDDADTMTRSSQNSLLKILEEPPEKALLILITHRAGALLPTVYSRCVHLPFQPLEDSALREVLVARRVCADDISLIVAMADGSLGKALEYADSAHLAMMRESLAFFQDWPDFKWSTIQSFSDVFGVKGNDDSQRIFRESLMWVASSLVRGHTDGLEGLDRISDSLDIESKIRIYDSLDEHFNRCSVGNLDKRFMILGAYMAFETA
ncbi:MAG: DNA polymerase III subunit delta' [Alphaproteobacteria bacterium]|nr:DNA polymerase III subunit delta' [Alphaproteobacteria bacterium]MCB9984727.1 DNA polymerase III subunit delta' [Micavibrio sp.]